MYAKGIKDALNADFKKVPMREQIDSTARIKCVDLMATENAPKHYTNMFELVKKLKTPIFRRGFPFSLRIEFNADCDLSKLELEFSFGSNPQPGNGTLINLEVSKSRTIPEGRVWGVCAAVSKGSKICNLNVKPSPTCQVGIWFLKVVTEEASAGRQVFNVPQHMYILFNPWCKDDEVYMEKDNWRQEYVLNDQGILYKENQYQQNWSFKQFDPTVLTAALYVLEIAEACGLSVSRRAIARDICKEYCNLDIQHVLEGNWTGHYEGGTSPMIWTGSYQILQQYMKNKQRVKYGQCWCYAGTRTAVFRALGIPCRPTTIYHTAIDSNNDLFIDILVDATTREGIGEKYGNFHVWNEVWMRRPDLILADGSDYGGWQVCDSGSVASLKAVKKGEVKLKINTLGIFSQIHAIEVTSTKLKDGRKVLEKIDYNRIGNPIVTKAVDDYKMQDIKLEYKYGEGSKEDRDVLLKAVTAQGSADKLKELELQISKIRGDFTFKIKVPDSTKIGEEIIISFEAVNNSNKERKVAFEMTAEAVDYRGVRASMLDRSKQPRTLNKKITTTIDIKPARHFNFENKIPVDVYLGKLCDLGFVRILATAEVLEGNQFSSVERDIVLTNPELTFNIPDQLNVLQVYTIIVKFTNPLNEELTDCSLSFNGSCNDFVDEGSAKTGNVKPHANVSIDVQFKPEVSGHCIVTAIFTSNLLKNLVGSKRVTVV